MKPMLFFFCLYFFSTCLSAQETFNFHNDLIPKVTGILNGFDPDVDDGLELGFVCVVPTPDGQEKKTVFPARDGRFEFTLEYPLHNQQIWFSIGTYFYCQLIVDKGLIITVNLEQLKKESENYISKYVKFDGPDNAINQLVNRYIVFESAHRDRAAGELHTKIMMDRNLSPAEKTTKIRAYYQQKDSLQKLFLAEYPTELDWVLENERLSDLYGELFVIHWGSEMPADLFAEAAGHSPKLCSNSGMLSYYGYLSNYLFILNPKERLAIYRDKLLPSMTIPEERERLSAFLQLSKDQEEGKDYDEKLLHKESSYFFRQYSDEILQATVDLFLIKTAVFSGEKGDLIKLKGGGEDILEREYYVTTLLPTLQNAWCFEIMESAWVLDRQKLEEINNKLKAIAIPATESAIGEEIGVLPNGAEFILAQQEKIDTLLGAIRAAFPGKALILDVWATWCGPCIYDMRESAENLKKLREMGVEVIYICTASGTTQDGWMKKVTELDLGAKHIYLTTALSRQIMDYFGLKGYPSHVFIDKSGGYFPNLVHAIRQIDFEALREKL